MSNQSPADQNGIDSEHLAHLIEHHEVIDWHEIPGISVAEASTWTQRLIDASQQLDEPPICNYCGFEIDEPGQQCTALDDGECQP